MENIPYILLGLCILTFFAKTAVFSYRAHAVSMARKLLHWTESEKIAWTPCRIVPERLNCLIYATWTFDGLWLLRRETHADKHSVYILELRTCEVEVLEDRDLRITGGSGSPIFCFKAATYCDGDMVVAPAFYQGDGVIFSEGSLVIKLWGLAHKNNLSVNRQIVLP